MTLEELRSPWQESNGGSMSLEKREELVARVCRRIERMESTIVRRDAIETVAAASVVVFFSGVFLRSEEPVAKVGAATVVVGALYIVYKLYGTRRNRKRSALDATVRDFCKTEMDRLDRQIELLRSVLWWYIIPILVGVNLVFFGSTGVGVGSMAYAIFTFFLGWWIYSMNRKAVAKTLVPARDELSGLLHELNGNR